MQTKAFVSLGLDGSVYGLLREENTTRPHSAIYLVDRFSITLLHQNIHPAFKQPSDVLRDSLDPPN